MTPVRVWLVNSDRFFKAFFNLFFFVNRILQYWFDWELDFINYFDFFLRSYHSFMTRVADLTCELGLTQVNLTCCYLNIRKGCHLELCFLVKLYFYELYELLLNPQIELDYIKSTFTQFKFFYARKKNISNIWIFFLCSRKIWPDPQCSAGERS